MGPGEDIRQARKRQKLTQRRLAELTGIAEITIRQYEAGLYSPKMEQLKKLSHALNVPIGELLTEEPLDGRKLDAANRGLKAILETVFDGVNFEWDFMENNDGEREYDGKFSVTLSKKNAPDIHLDMREWAALLSYVRQSLPAHIELIQAHNPNG